MKKVTTITSVVIVGLYLILLMAIFWEKNMYSKVIAGSFGVLAGLFLIIGGFIISLFKKAKDFGLGVMIAGTLIEIIGIGVCSTT